MSEHTVAKRIVIVGGGQAAASAAVRLRDNGYGGEVVIVCGEPSLPYQRPPLSKTYLKEIDKKERLLLRTEEYYERAGIQTFRGNRATAIARSTKTLQLSDGRTLRYDKLILATGGEAVRLPPTIAAESPNIHTFRDIGDADRLRRQMESGRKMLVVGGGYIGLEMAAVATQLGMQVALIEQADRILKRVAAAETSDYLRKLHQDHGVEILESARLKGVAGGASGTASYAVLEDGRSLPFDVAIVGIGLRPCAELASSASLVVENGIVVDDMGRTSDQSIYAVGDCSNFPYRGGRLRLESVQNAIAQAEHVADVICDLTSEPYQPKPWFWSDQYATKLQIAGLNSGYDRTVTRTGRRPNSLSVWYFRGDEFLAVDALNDPQAFMVGKRLLDHGTRLLPEAVADTAVGLKGLIEA